MSHNPARPKSLDDKALALIAGQVEAKKKIARSWEDLADLARQMNAKADAGMQVVLKPDTAKLIAFHLSICHVKPTRDEVALLICRRSSREACDQPCFECAGRANAVVNAYGFRLNHSSPSAPPPEGPGQQDREDG